MPFMNYLGRQQHEHHQMNKRSHTLPTVLKKKKEIGDYILCRTIGRGASGRVKLGIHKQTGEKVAIKMISRSQLTASNTTSKSVQRELAVLQLLHHPHLVQLRQVLQDTSYVYFVMEYLEGGELFHILAERGRLPEDEARHLFAQLINALTWCHAHHISHRDLKPENILLDKEKKNIKIADFGMAAMQPLNALLRTSCGSPHYASPEIVKGKRYDGKATDVWSCGAILYAMMTGHLPFDDEHMGRLLAKIKTGRYRSLPDYLSTDAKDLIKRMLVVDPTKRMTMAEILQHPWLTNQSFLGTELRFLQKSYTEGFDPLQDPQLDEPMITNKFELDGRIWETLKVLWREKTENDLLVSLSSYGRNVQKLTCKLLQERSIRLDQQSPENNSSVSLPLRRCSAIADDVLMTPPLRSLRHVADDVEPYTLSTPYESSVDTMSCCRTLDFPPTPKSSQLLDTTYASSITVNMDHYLNKKRMLDKNEHPMDAFSLLSPIRSTRYWIHDDGELVQTEENRGSKADAAGVFIMTQSTIVKKNTCSLVHARRSTWRLCSKGEPSQSNWITRYFKKSPTPNRVVTVECYTKNECETAGKLHQVLEECYDGKLTGRMYPHEKIVWSGIMNHISFTCQMTKLNGEEQSKIRIQFTLSQGQASKLESHIQDLVDCLNMYETESDWVTRTNGWTQPEII